eukprot:scaffold28859_cov63-Phaeocystis_antarctica.AAC.1
MYRHKRAWNEGENSAVFGAAVAHGLAPAAAAASSDALRPKPLAASPGTASACMLKCAMRLGSKGVELKGVGVSR